MWDAFLKISHNLRLVSLTAINTKQEDYFSERINVVIVVYFVYKQRPILFKHNINK